MTSTIGRPNRQVDVRSALSRIAGPSVRRLCSLRTVREQMAPWIAGHPEISAFSPNGTGLGPAETLREAHRRHSFTGGTAVVLGAGVGTESDMLVPFGVDRIVGADLEAHPARWQRRRGELAGRGVAATFSLMDGVALGLRESSVDVMFSQSVLEHVVDLDAALLEASRVLKPEGRFAAWFGPLWHTFGGPHVTELGFDHLLVDDDELIARARRIGSGWEYWLELGLFNRLRYDEYLTLLERHFVVEWVGVAGSREAAAFRDQQPDSWAELVDRYDEFDLMARVVGVVARPRR